MDDVKHAISENSIDSTKYFVSPPPWDDPMNLVPFSSASFQRSRINPNKKTAVGFVFGMEFREVSMIRDFGYPISSTDLKLSEDGRYLLSVGVYKPSIRVYDLDNLALKIERHLESDATRILPLSEDGTKLCVLRNDRNIEFHAKYGHHESVRVPSFCFDVCLNEFRAEVLAGGSGKSIYRFNLDQGRFLNSYSTAIEEVLCIGMSRPSGLIGIGGDNKVEFVDQRNREIVRTVEYQGSPSALAFSENGIDFGVGTSEGVVYFHDLRTRKEVFRSEHSAGVRRLVFNGKLLLSVDKHLLRCCSRTGVAGEYSSEEVVNCLDCDDGVVFLGLDNGEMKTILSNELGKAPSWCRMLED